MRTAPTATCCQKGCTPVMTKPFWRTAGMNRPKTVPKMVPIPPKSDVPPMTTAAMTFRFVCDCPARSEDHTYELQSLMRISYAVFCLKNKNNVCRQQKYHNT